MTGGERVEDPALLSGRGRFIDDLPVPPRTLHAAILRSPHAHARLGPITAPEGVRLFAGPDIAAGLRPFIAALRTPMRHFPVATDKVRYAGEPVAVVLAEDRYRAEDALELVEVEYEPLPAVVSPSAAIAEGAPLLHEAAGTNLANRRRFFLRRPGRRLRRRRPSLRHRGALSAQRGDAHRVFRPDRRLGPGRRRL